MLGWLLSKMFPKEEETVPNITDPYRVNRMIRSKYNNGDYIVLDPVLHHYGFEIDGSVRRFGIAEVLSAIKALDEAGL